MRYGGTWWLIVCGSLSLLAACDDDATSGSNATTTGATASEETGNALDLPAPTPAVTEEFCAQFLTEAACVAAVAADAPYQCAFFNKIAGSFGVVDDGAQRRCRFASNSDYDGRECHLVEFVPWACELPEPPPFACPDGSEIQILPAWWMPELPEFSLGWGLPCELRPATDELHHCWEELALGCTCHCYQPACNAFTDPPCDTTDHLSTKPPPE